MRNTSERTAIQEFLANQGVVDTQPLWRGSLVSLSGVEDVTAVFRQLVAGSRFKLNELPTADVQRHADQLRRVLPPLQLATELANALAKRYIAIFERFIGPKLPFRETLQRSVRRLGPEVLGAINENFHDGSDLYHRLSRFSLLRLLQCGAATINDEQGLRWLESDPGPVQADTSRRCTDDAVADLTQWLFERLNPFPSRRGLEWALGLHDDEQVFYFEAVHEEIQRGSSALLDAAVEQSMKRLPHRLRRSVGRPAVASHTAEVLCFQRRHWETKDDPAAYIRSAAFHGLSADVLQDLAPKASNELTDDYAEAVPSGEPAIDVEEVSRRLGLSGRLAQFYRAHFLEGRTIQAAGGQLGWDQAETRRVYKQLARRLRSKTGRKIAQQLLASAPPTRDGAKRFSGDASKAVYREKLHEGEQWTGHSTYSFRHQGPTLEALGELLGRKTKKTSDRAGKNPPSGPVSE